MSRNCIFCRIIEGESPANFVYRDEDFVVFHNIRPSAPVHVLMVPVEHVESLNDLEMRHSQVVGKMMVKAKEIAELLDISKTGYKLVINVGVGAGQVVFHLHIHLIGGWNPR
ncbi:MAG: histidine triad nucleotide-binding protein [Candidatus Methanoperedens sp.]|nr:histidine triad nucleotide-binding protein [Candidatus Methanoperedens sp.]